MDSSSAPATKQTKGIKKLWLKVKASMKSEQASSSTKAVPASTTPKTTTATTPSEPAPAAVKETTPAPAAPKTEQVKEEVKPDNTPIMAKDTIEVDEEDDTDEKFELPQVTSTSNNKQATAQRYQRAQDVFKKYNLDMDPADWQQQNNSTVERVEKKPRMRVRYTCHECKQTYGRDKKCSACTHMRCDQCVRYPPKKTGDKVKQAKKVEEDPSTLVAPTTGACHECKTTFDLGATECGNCNHQICSRCLKETVLASPATAPPPAQPISIAAAS